MAKLLGSDIVTTSELEEFSKGAVKLSEFQTFVEDVTEDIKARVETAEAQAGSFKWACIIGGASLLINLGLTIHLLVR